MTKGHPKDGLLINVEGSYRIGFSVDPEASGNSAFGSAGDFDFVNSIS